MLCFKKDHPKTPVVKHLQHPSIFGIPKPLNFLRMVDHAIETSKSNCVQVRWNMYQKKQNPTKRNHDISWYIMTTKTSMLWLLKPHTSNFRTGFSYSNPNSPGLKRPPPDWSSRDDRYCVTLLSGYRCPPSNIEKKASDLLRDLTMFDKHNSTLTLWCW